MTDRWGSIADPLARFRAMGKALDDYVFTRSTIPGMWDDDSAWAAYDAKKNALQNEWLGTLSPDEKALWDRDTAFSAAQNKKHMNTGMGIAGGLIGLGAGGMALGQLGLLGGASPAAQAVPASVDAALAGTDSLMATGLPAGIGGAAAPAVAAAPAAAAAPAVPAAVDAALAGTDALMATGLPAAAPASGLLGNVGTAASGALDWLNKNRGLVSLLGGALGTIGGSVGGNKAAEPTYAPQPGLTIKPLQQQGGMGPFGSFTPSTGQGMANSGLARYGARGGLFSVLPQNTPMWGR